MMRSPKPQHTLALGIIEKPSISKGAPIWLGSVYIYSARILNSVLKNNSTKSKLNIYNMNWGKFSDH